MEESPVPGRLPQGVRPNLNPPPVAPTTQRIECQSTYYTSP